MLQKKLSTALLGAMLMSACHGAFPNAGALNAIAEESDQPKRERIPSKRGKDDHEAIAKAELRRLRRNDKRKK